MQAAKGSVRVALVLIVLLLVPAVMPTRHIARQLSPHNSPPHVMRRQGIEGGRAAKPGNSYEERRSEMKRKRPETLEIAGSSLPDCAHACGSCSPCRLVMVRFLCASVEESETCPMAYKCMCSDKSFPVP